MPEQLALGDDRPGKVRADHPATARHAASLVKTGSIRFEVLRYLAGRFVSGATDEELADALQRSENTVRPRRIECVQDGWAVDSGKTRDSKWGRPMTVWVATDTGRNQLEVAALAKAKR